MEKICLSKIYTLINLIKLMSLILAVPGITADRKTWTYELISVVSTSSDPEKFQSNLEVARVSRGVYAISGDVSVNFDIVEGDSNHIAVKSFRSSQGGDDYKILPFQVSEAHFFNILNTYYKNVIMDTLKECSNMPVFEDKFEPPLEKKTYKFEACKFSQDGFPNHLQEGLYKVSIIGTGEVDWQIDITAECTAYACAGNHVCTVATKSLCIYTRNSFLSFSNNFATGPKHGFAIDYASSLRNSVTVGNVCTDFDV